MLLPYFHTMAMANMTSKEIGADEQKILEDKEDEIIRLLDIPTVLTSLQQQGIINYTDAESIHNLESQKDKVQNFIARLSVRGKNAYQTFIDVLRESSTKNHTELADILGKRPPAIDFVEKRIEEIRFERQVDRKFKEHETRIKLLEDENTARQEVEKFQTLLQAKETELKEIKTRMEQQENEVNVLKEEHQRLLREIEEIRREKDKWEERANSLKLRVDALEKKNAFLEEEQIATKQFMQQIVNKQKETDKRLENMEKKSERQARSTIVPANRFQPQPRPPGQGGTTAKRTETRRGK